MNLEKEIVIRPGTRNTGVFCRVGPNCAACVSFGIDIPSEYEYEDMAQSLRTPFLIQSLRTLTLFNG